MDALNNETLKLIEERRVFKIEEYKGKLYLFELCDEYFAIELTKEICEDLSVVFKEIAKEL